MISRAVGLCILFLGLFVCLHGGSALAGDDGPRLYPFLDGERWGYLDASGEVVIEPRFHDAGSFSEGLAYVTLGESADEREGGYIDMNGEFVIGPGPRYRGGVHFLGDVALVSDDGTRRVIDRTGDFVDFDVQYDDVLWWAGSDGIVVLAREEPIYRHGAVRTDGEIIIPFDYYDILMYSNGYVRIQALAEDGEDEGSGKWGFADREGNIVIEPRYDDARNVGDNGLAGVQLDGSWFFINMQGERVIEDEFDDVGVFADGLVPVKQGERWHYINADGQKAFEGNFYDAASFTDGRAFVGKHEPSDEFHDTRWGLIDTSGRAITGYHFRFAPVIRGDLIWVVWDVGASAGYINRDGVLVGYHTGSDNVWHRSNLKVGPETALPGAE